MTLIKEINDLRRELSQSRTRVHDLEAALGVHRASTVARATGGSGALASSTSKNAVLQQQLEEKCKVVELQRSEIMRLRAQLMDLERPASGGGGGPASRPSSAAVSYTHLTLPTNREV